MSDTLNKLQIQNLLPVLFNPESLKNELSVRVGELEIKKE